MLDDATVQRVIRVYREKQQMHGDYEWQLDRWRRVKLTAAQRREVERLAVERHAGW